MSQDVKRVLLVEDLDDDVLFFKLACKKSGFEPVVEVKTNGDEAMDYLAKVNAHTIPHLVLLDMKMPKTGGLEVLAWIRKQEIFTTLPVVMFTSSSNPQDISAALRLGANSFITKTGDIGRLRNIVCTTLSYWFEVNHQPLEHPRV